MPLQRAGDTEKKQEETCLDMRSTVAVAVAVAVPVDSHLEEERAHEKRGVTQKRGRREYIRVRGTGRRQRQRSGGTA